MISSVLGHSISSSSMKNMKLELDMIKTVMLVEAQYDEIFPVSKLFEKENLKAIYFLASSIHGMLKNCTW